MCLLALLLAPVTARADALVDALAGFANDSFPETEAAIAAVTATGAPQAEAVLRALADRRLVVDPATRAVLLKTADGDLRDAATGAPVATEPPDLVPVRLNNRLRSAVDAALGTLTLRAADPERRRQAAESALKAREPKSLPALETALAAEQDAAIRTVLATARAAILLNAPDASTAVRLEAVETLAQRSDRETVGLLRAVAEARAPDEVKRAAAAAVDRIDRRLAILTYIQNIWYGLSLGSVLLLAAIGLAITFGVMGVINMAHGEMVMLGAYTTFVVQEVFRAHAPTAFDWSLPVALPVAFLVAAAVGIVIERGIIRFLYGRPLETLLATWGVSLILQQAIRTGFGPTNREVGAPSYMSGAFDLMGVAITYGRLWIIVFTLVVFAGLLLVMRVTTLGLQMRAVTQNRRMAGAMGIRTGRVDALTFGLGSGIAGIAGVALSQIDNVSPNLGQSYIIDSFLVVVFGGVGNLWGTFVSALALGIANKFLEPVAGAVLAKILILVLLILFVQKRPRGLFALKGRAVDA